MKMRQAILLQNTRNFIDDGLRIRLTAGTETDIKNMTEAFQKIINQIPDKIIYSLLEDPNLTIEFHRIKPKPSNVLSNAKRKQTPGH